jgi:hypothetical protein
MTTNGPSLASDLVRPLLERVTRSRMISLEQRADDECCAPERSGWSWRLRIGAQPPNPREPSERAGWSWRVRTSVRTPGEGGPSERQGWSWLRARPVGGWSWLRLGHGRQGWSWFRSRPPGGWSWLVGGDRQGWSWQPAGAASFSHA